VDRREDSRALIPHLSYTDPSGHFCPAAGCVPPPAPTPQPTGGGGFPITCFFFPSLCGGGPGTGPGDSPPPQLPPPPPPPLPASQLVSNKTCPAGPSKIISASATTNAPTIAAGAAICEAIGGPPAAFFGVILGSLFGVGGNVSYVPSTNSWYAGPTVVFAPSWGGGQGISANYVNVPSTQNANSIANGASYSITFQPYPFFGSVVTKSPGSGPPVVGPSVGTRVPVSVSAGKNICLRNCGC